jgi:hypothetical protein
MIGLFVVVVVGVIGVIGVVGLLIVISATRTWWQRGVTRHS